MMALGPQSGIRLAVVGRGRAAAALVPRWVAAGFELVDQRARGYGPASALAAADVVVLAVPDGALQAVAAELATRASASGEVWLHLSGSRPASVLRVDGERPRAVGGLHPLVALADAATSLDGAVAGLDGEDEAVALADVLARAAGLTPTRLGAGAGMKMAYHAAAVTVAGHATALFAQAMALMATAGIGPEMARAALQPLFRSAAENLARGGPAEVSTGSRARRRRDCAGTSRPSPIRISARPIGGWPRRRSSWSARACRRRRARRCGTSSGSLEDRVDGRSVDAVGVAPVQLGRAQARLVEAAEAHQRAHAQRQALFDQRASASARREGAWPGARRPSLAASALWACSRSLRSAAGSASGARGGGGVSGVGAGLDRGRRGGGRGLGRRGRRRGCGLVRATGSAARRCRARWGRVRTELARRRQAVRRARRRM
ncbi:MAG: DUF2520 domain-containing protein [Myxococcota bacterium]